MSPLRRRGALTGPATRALTTCGAYLIFAALCIVSCRTISEIPSPPESAGGISSLEIFAADSTRAGLVRAQAGQLISCTDQKFDGMLCLSEQDFLKLVIEISELRKSCQKGP